VEICVDAKCDDEESSFVSALESDSDETQPPVKNLNKVVGASSSCDFVDLVSDEEELCELIDLTNDDD